MDESCPFCQRIAHGETQRSGGDAHVIPDAYPVADGHLLIIPTRHVADLRALDAGEVRALWALAHEYASAAGSDGVTIGANVGAAAGQTIDHAHIHVIPRQWGDVADPRGGVRGVIPGRAAYWDDATTR